MSERLNSRVVTHLRANMFPTLPAGVQALFPIVPIDQTLGSGPNIIVGPIAEKGVGIAFPCIAAWTKGALEGLTRRRYVHFTLFVDFWVQSPGPDGRRILGILYEYTSRALQDVNWSGDQISIKRCFETEKSDVMFEAPEKLYHLSNLYRVEAIGQGSWY